jgi:hypothetical protein
MTPRAHLRTWPDPTSEHFLPISQGLTITRRLQPNGLHPLHFEVLSTPRRGGRAIRLERLRLRELLHWLSQVIEEAYGTIGETQTERQLCSELLN